MPEPKEPIVSALVRARAELEEALYELEKLPAVSQNSVSFAAHALNNFLTVTGGTVELLQLVLADYPDPQVRIGLEALEQATNLMTHTVSQLMNASTGQNANLRMEKVDLPVMVQRFVTFYQRIADRKQIRLFSGSTVDVPSAWTDRVAIAAVLDNLFSNAVKYSPPGKRIWAQVHADRHGVVCSIRDEGPGLSQEDQAKLFQRGAQLTPKPTGGELSTGYGLAVAKEFVEKLGGTIWCDSVLGEGATFSFRLPRHEKQVSGPEQASPGRPSLAENGEALTADSTDRMGLRLAYFRTCSWRSKTMNRTINVILVMLLCVGWLATLPSKADGQYRCAVTIELKGKTILQGQIRDIERPSTDQLWELLMTLAFAAAKDSKDAPNPESVEQATLKGDLRVKVNGAGQVDLKELNLVRNGQGAKTWVIAPADFARIVKMRKAPAQEQPTK